MCDMQFKICVIQYPVWDMCHAKCIALYTLEDMWCAIPGLRYALSDRHCRIYIVRYAMWDMHYPFKTCTVPSPSFPPSLVSLTIRSKPTNSQIKTRSAPFHSVFKLLPMWPGRLRKHGAIRATRSTLPASTTSGLTAHLVACAHA